MFGLFSKKCSYCRNKVNAADSVKRDVKVPGYNGTYPKDFCDAKHADSYENEVTALANAPKKEGGSCCG